MRTALTLGLLGALLSACSSGGAPPRAKYNLEGSLSVVMDLGWDECFLETATGEIAVRFARNYPQSDGTVITDMPFKIVWAQAGQMLTTPSTIDLAEPRPDDASRQRTTISRNVRDDKRMAFPPMVRGPAVGGPGKMSFIDEIRPGAMVKGQFNITFENGIDFAHGRTVYGQFNAKVPE